MNKENISIRGFMGKIRRGKSSCLSKIKQEKKRKQREYPFPCSDALSNNNTLTFEKFPPPPQLLTQYAKAYVGGFGWPMMCANSH